MIQTFKVVVVVVVVVPTSAHPLLFLNKWFIHVHT